jgi:hypothetical protein
VSEPWLVFEWYLVEGLVRTAESGHTIGLPGSLKAARAITEGVPLSSKRYLKTPSIFGFHGIYRLLSRTLGIEAGGRLGEAGYELLRVWSKEQDLEGFVGTAAGPGRAMRRQWVDAVRDGLDKGATARSSSWVGWSHFNQHLGIYRTGPKERRHLAAQLIADTAGFRREVIEFLVSSAGQELWQTNESERRFHAALRSGANTELRLLLDAIACYETFSRLCQDAFDDALCEMTQQRGKTSPEQLGRLKSMQIASRRVPEMFSEVQSRLEPFGEAPRFQSMFGALAEPGGPAAWATRLAEHHRKIQRLKPPDGKNPWFERFDDGSYIIRPLYKRDAGGRHNDAYVHAYRTGSLWSFARDLKLVGP